MEGAAIAAGIGGTVTINGKQYSLRGKTLEYYALVEAEIIKLRGNPLDLIVGAAKELGLGDRGALLVDTVARAVSDRFRNWRFATYKDHGEFFDTPYGDAFTIWCCIKHNPDPPTVEEIRKWIWDQWNATGSMKHKEEVLATIDRASGEDMLGN